MDQYRHLRVSLPQYGDDDRIPLSLVLETNGLDDALWALRAVVEGEEAERDRVSRQFACRCIRETPLASGGITWDLLTDPRSRHAVEVAEKYAVGDATQEELDAAWGTAFAARDAAWNASRNAALGAASSAAWVAHLKIFIACIG